MMKIKNIIGLFFLVAGVFVSNIFAGAAAEKKQGSATESSPPNNFKLHPLAKEFPSLKDLESQEYWDSFFAGNGLFPVHRVSIILEIFKHVRILKMNGLPFEDARSILYAIIKKVIAYPNLAKRRAILGYADPYGMTNLYLAVLINDLEIVKLLCKFSGLSHDQLLVTGLKEQPLLHLCVHYGYLPILDFLVNDQHFPLDQQALDGFTALNLAVHLENKDCVKMLLEAGANLEIRSYKDLKFTPLLGAVASGNVEILKLLVQYGANLNACTATNSSALSVSTFEENECMVEFLLRFGGALAYVNNTDLRTLNNSYQFKKKIVRRLFIDAGLLRVDNPLLSALAAGEDVVSLLTEKYKAFADKVHPVHMAVMSKACRCLELVLLQDSSVATLLTFDGKSPLSMALTALSQDGEACAFLAETGVCVGPARMIYLLLEHGAQIHLAHPSVRTVLDANPALNPLIAKVQQSLAALREYFTERDASIRARVELEKCARRRLALEIEEIIAQESAQRTLKKSKKAARKKQQKSMRSLVEDEQAPATEGSDAAGVSSSIDSVVSTLENLSVAGDGQVELEVDASIVRLFLRRQASPVDMQVLPDTFGNGQSIRFLGASSRHCMHMAKQEAVLEKSFIEATDGFEVVDTKRKYCLSIADNVEACLVKNIREQQCVIDSNVLDHAWTEELLLRVLTCGSVYLEKPVDGASVCLLVVAQVNRTLPADFGVAWDSRPRFITLCFDLDDDGEIGECFHCCSQWHHPYDVRLPDGRKKYDLVPVDVCAWIDARGKLLLEGGEGFMETYINFARLSR